VIREIGADIVLGYRSAVLWILRPGPLYTNDKDWVPGNRGCGTEAAGIANTPTEGYHCPSNRAELGAFWVMSDVVLEHLRKTFGTVVALDDFTVRVSAGELFFALGPSGCGKTTLLRCLAGFCEPDSGKIKFGQEEITALPAHKRNTVMVFQSYALWPHMTVEQNVAFGLRVRRVGRQQRRQAVRGVLELVQMAELAGRKPHALSGGQQQRVALARALVVHPRCLLLDEPLSNLDAKLRLEMRGEIRRICKQANVTTIYVTHDQSEALSIADRIAVLRNGRLEQVGQPRELYNRPTNRFVAGFLGETTFLEGSVIGGDQGQVVVGTAMGRLRGSSGDRTTTTGDKVVCSIRPESVRLGRPPADAANRLGAKIIRTSYLGQMARHELLIGSTKLIAFELNPQSPGLAQHQEVQAWIDPDDVVVLS